VDCSQWSDCNPKIRRSLFQVTISLPEAQNSKLFELLLYALQKSQCKMAANYWESTQRRHWQYTRQQLDDLRKKLEDEDQNLVQMYPLPQLRHLSIYFNQRMSLPFPDSCSKTNRITLQRLLVWANALV
jgi:hypothetical protein